LANESHCAGSACVTRSAAPAQGYGRWTSFVICRPRMSTSMSSNHRGERRGNRLLCSWHWLLFFWPQGHRRSSSWRTVYPVRAAYISGETGIRRLPGFLSGLVHENNISLRGRRLFYFVRHFRFNVAGPRARRLPTILGSRRRIDGPSRPSCCPECTRPGRRQVGQ